MENNENTVYKNFSETSLPPNLQNVPDKQKDINSPIKLKKNIKIKRIFLIILISLIIISGSIYFLLNNPFFSVNINFWERPPDFTLSSDKDWQRYDNKNKLQKILQNIVYLQPTYLPKGFKKITDINNNDFAVVTFFSNPQSGNNYDNLTITQYSLEEAQKQNLYPLEKLEEKSNIKLIKRLKINNKPALYIETPGYVLDPYFNIGFRGSEDEQLLKTENDKKLYIIYPETFVEIYLQFGCKLSSDRAFEELKKVGLSLKKANIPEHELELSEKDILEIEAEQLRQTSAYLRISLDGYLNKYGNFPWDISTECNNGNLPVALNANSKEFSKCIEMVKEFLVSGDPDNIYTKVLPEIYSQFFVAGYQTEHFQQERVNSEDITIYSFNDELKKRARVCYKPKIIPEHVTFYLNQTNKMFIDDYPMYTKTGDVDLSCKENPLEKDCYHCTKTYY